jgi:uncharacterized protein
MGNANFTKHSFGSGGFVTTTQSAHQHAQPAGGVRGFLNKGGIWRFVLVAVAYLAIYQVARLTLGSFGSDYGDDDLLSSVGAVFFQLTVGLIAGSIVLIFFVVAMGWGSEIFGRQRIYRSWWMWLAPILVLIPITMRVLGFDWGGTATSVLVMVFATGALIGFSEELLFRGIGVKMVRDGGHREGTVAIVTALLFGLSHSINIFSGEAPRTVALTVVYTVAFGILMYLSMRAIGFLVAAMILHGLTDPTTLLAVGGIVDQVEAADGSSGLIALAGGVTLFVVVPVAFILACFIRGKIGEVAKGQVAVEPDSAAAA